MDVKIRVEDSKLNIVKVTYKRKEVFKYLHALHENSKEFNVFGLYDIEENSRNVNLYFKFKNEVSSFDGIIAYIESIYIEVLANQTKLHFGDALNKKMEEYT